MDSMKAWAVRVGLVVLFAGVCAGQARAQSVMSLTLSAGSVTFPTADPDTTPIIVAPPLGVTLYSRRTPWQLTVMAGGDLTSGSSTIPVSNISWTATPVPPFQAGVMSSTVAQMMASDTGLVDLTATVVYSLVNSWTYDPGTYTVTITYTLSGV